MVTIIRGSYILLLSYNPCDIFTHFGVTEMHGLNITDCSLHINNENQSYIAGWSNFIPKESGEYTNSDPRFVFINLNRCNNEVWTICNIFHELMHHSLCLHDYDVENKEEEIISWADNETIEVYKIVKPLLK